MNTVLTAASNGSVTLLLISKKTSILRWDAASQWIHTINIVRNIVAFQMCSLEFF